MSSSEADLDYSDLVGLSEAELVERLGPPDVRTGMGGELWLIRETRHGRLRLRLARAPSDSEPRVASWTLSLREGRDTLRHATEALGLWPAAAPDVNASDLDAPLARRPLQSARGDRVRSLTATIGRGRFTRVSVFDEAPDWL